MTDDNDGPYEPLNTAGDKAQEAREKADDWLIAAANSSNGGYHDSAQAKALIALAWIERARDHEREAVGLPVPPNPGFRWPATGPL